MRKCDGPFGYSKLGTFGVRHFFSGFLQEFFFSLDKKHISGLSILCQTRVSVSLTNCIVLYKLKATMLDKAISCFRDFWVRCLPIRFLGSCCSLV